MFEEEDVDTEPPSKKAKQSKGSKNSGKENKRCSQTPNRNRATTSPTTDIVINLDDYSNNKSADQENSSNKVNCVYI